MTRSPGGTQPSRGDEYGGSGHFPEGQRNTTLCRIAGALWRQGVTEETLFIALLSENTQRCDPPLPEAEVKQIARYLQGTEAAQEPYTEMGNAKRFISQHGQDLRFVPLWKKWLAWDGTRWAVDDTYKVIPKAKEIVWNLPTELASIQEDDKRRAFLQHIAPSEGYRWIANIVELAKSEPGVPVSVERDGSCYLAAYTLAPFYGHNPRC